MEIEQLQTLLNIRDKTLALSSNQLGNSDIKVILETYFPEKGLTMENIELTTSDNQITITGSMTYLSIRDEQALAMFKINDSEVTLKLTIHLPETWKFSQSFPSLKNSLFDKILLENPEFVLSSIQENGTSSIAKGLNFSAMALLSGPPCYADWLLDESKSLVLQGSIVLDNGFPKMKLKVQKEAEINVGFLDIPISIALISDQQVDDTQAESPISIIRVDSQLKINDNNIPILGFYTPSSDTVFIQAEIDLPIPSLTAVSAMFDQAYSFEGLEELGVTVSDLKLKNLGVALALSSKKLMFLSTQMSSSEKWTIIDDVFSVSNIRLDFVIMNHSPKYTITTCISGNIEIGEDIKLGASVVLPNRRISAKLIKGNEIDLSKITSRFLPGIQDLLPNLVCIDFTLGVDIDAKSYLLSIDLEGDWQIPLGKTVLAITDVSMDISHTGTDTTGTIRGTTKIGAAFFDINWNLPGDFKISGTLPQISFKTLITELCGNISPLKELFSNDFDLVLEKTEICIQKDDSRSTASFATQVAGFGTMILYIQSDPTAVVVAFDLPDEWKLSSLGLPNDYDGISFSQNLLVISSLDDPSFQLPGLDLFESGNLPATFQAIPGNQGVRKGLDFHSHIALDQDMFDEVMHWLNLSENLSLPVNIRISVDPFSAELAAKISEDSPIDISGIRLTNPQLQMGVGMSDPYFGVGATVEMVLNGQIIQVQGNIDVEANGAQIEAIFDGSLSWNEIFGIPASVSTTNPTVVFGFSFQGLPTLGLSGDFQIDQLAGTLAVSLNSMNPAQSMLSGTFEEIKLDGLVSTFCESGVQVSAELAEILSQTSLSDVNLYIVPTNTTIGEDEYEAGFKFSGDLHVMGLGSTVNVELNPKKGIDFSADMNKPLAIGSVLTLSGDEGTDGPSIAICTYSDNPKFAFSGLAIVSDVFSVATEITTANGACSFMVDADVFNYFHLQMDADNIKLSDLSTFNCDLTLKMNVDQIGILISNVLNNIQLAAADAKSVADQAKQSLNAANSALNSVYDSIVQGMKNEIKHKQNLINSNKTTINNYKRTGDRRYGHYVRYVRRNGYWTYTRNRWGVRIPRWVGPQYGTRWAIYIWITTNIKALEISNNSLATDIKNLNSNINLVKTVGPFLSQASKNAINAARSGVSTATEAYNQATAAINKDLAKAANWISSNSGNLLEIHSITIDTKLGDLMSSSFKASVDYTLTQQNRGNLSVQLDINQIENFTTAVANKLIEELKKLF